MGVKEESKRARQGRRLGSGGVPAFCSSGELGLAGLFCLRSSMHGRVGARIAPPCRSHPRQNKRRPRRPAPGRDWCSPVRSVKTHDETVPKLEDHASRTVSSSWFGSWSCRAGRETRSGSRWFGWLVACVRCLACALRLVALAPHHHRLEWRVRPPTPPQRHRRRRHAALATT